MDTVLDYLTKQKEELEYQLKVIEYEIKGWLEFQKLKSDNKLKIKQTIPRKDIVRASITGVYPTIQSNATKTTIERICDALKDNNAEMYASQIAEQIKDIYKGKPNDWILRRVSSILSDEKNKTYLYSYARREKGQHHLAKVWGLNIFKDKDGQVKEEHKYKSIQ